MTSHSPTRRYPLGARLTLQQLDADPYGPLARLRETEPISWVPVLGGWLVTRRDLCIDVMRDASLFTVDDQRFSTARVVGPSMLSLDGDDHRRHRDPFASAFLGPESRSRFAALADLEAGAVHLDWQTTRAKKTDLPPSLDDLRRLYPDIGRPDDQRRAANDGDDKRT